VAESWPIFHDDVLIIGTSDEDSFIWSLDLRIVPNAGRSQFDASTTREPAIVARFPRKSTGDGHDVDWQHNLVPVYLLAGVVGCASERL
jgi:hypothetical protein